MGRSADLKTGCSGEKQMIIRKGNAVDSGKFLDMLKQ
jgi:hypothetical protein